MKILIAEDQKSLNTILKERLTHQGFIVDAVFDGEEASDIIQYMTYDVIILDIMMPKKNGLEVLQELRNYGVQTPVLILTAKDKIDDRVKGLDLGADDYLIKPFAFEELVARIRALSRRKAQAIQDILTCGDLTLNPTSHEVKRGKDDIQLSKKEYLIVEYLIRHKNEVVSRERLENVTSDYDYEGYSNVIDVFIKMIRKKIDHPYTTKLIHTVRGFGYSMRDSL